MLVQINQTNNRKNGNESCLNELNELKFCEAFYLEKQKSFIPKKNMR